MNLIQDNFEIAVQLFHSIWSRTPVIIQIETDTSLSNLLEELLVFIPDYRPFIICGALPRQVLRHRRNVKYIETETPETIQETLESTFAEERSGHTRPLQVLYLHADSGAFSTALPKIDRGWVAITRLSLAEIAANYPITAYTVHHAPELNAKFILKFSADCRLEVNLLEKIKSRNVVARTSLLQKKFCEIRYTNEALVREIETGQTLNQLEIQEHYEIDPLHFAKCLEVLEVEHYLDIRRYIRMASPQFVQILETVSQLNGVIWVGAWQQQHLIGLARAKTSVYFPVNALTRLSSFILETQTRYQFGEIRRLKMDLQDGSQLIFVNFASAKRSPAIILGVLVQPGQYAVVIFNQIETMLAEFDRANEYGT
ncbi:hypothetical protein L0128_07840 [candidate division KSB1 bacterium]|nr:hypothetical protein [candidate division KSB1 bacterium]